MIPEHPVWIENLTDEQGDIDLDSALRRHGSAVVLDATAKLVEEVFGAIDAAEGLNKISEENLVLAKGALEGAAKAERGYADPQEKV